jgi:molybdopterin-synthase adenylyltransferase
MDAMTIEGRYSRQERFAPIGRKGQEQIRAARILITGCGGLGSNSANLLARAGVGFLRIVDRDVIELSNLQRQLLFDQNDAREGWPKALAAGRHLAAINSDLNVEPVAADIGSDNIFDFLQGIDLVLDGFDNLEARYLLNDACVKQNVPWIYGCCVSSTVMAALIVPGKTACFRCLHRDLPEPGSVRTCDTAGVIGPAALIAASIQTSMALRFLTNKTCEAPLIVGDAWDFSLDTIVVRRDDKCPCCVFKQFDFLKMRGQQALTLCGRNAVQVRAAFDRRPDFKALAARLGAVGAVRVNEDEDLLRLDAPPYALTLFEDGRAIVKGTDDPLLARSLVARWIGV